jgi:hypothetical protein
MSSRTLPLLSLATLLGCSSTPSTGNDASTAQDVVSVTDRGSATDAPAATDAQADPCVGLGEYCHDVDPGSGPIHDCHEGAHDSTPVWCAANAVRCRQLCTEARDAGARSDATAHGHDGSADGGAHQH